VGSPGETQLKKRENMMRGEKSLGKLFKGGGGQLEGVTKKRKGKSKKGISRETSPGDFLGELLLAGYGLNGSGGTQGSGDAKKGSLASSHGRIRGFGTARHS